MTKSGDLTYYNAILALINAIIASENRKNKVIMMTFVNTQDLNIYVHLGKIISKRSYAMKFLLFGDSFVLKKCESSG